jgi:thiamine biosynthesis lipoprotein
MDMQMKPKILISVFLLFIVFTLGMLLLRKNAYESFNSGTVEVTSSLMGTSWTVKIPLDGNLERETALSAVDSVFTELERIESLMSEWQPDTPVSQVNSNAGLRPVEVPEELVRILERGIEYGRLSQGSFDITWRGMGALWKFGEDFRVPGEKEVADAVKRVDFRKIMLDGNIVFLPEPGMAIGLGGIAKGYAIDRAGMKIRQAGIKNFLVDGGGDILASGSINGRSWLVGIRDPRGERSDLLNRLSVSGGAIVTSGDYERFRIVDGRRYHHIIDPRTGYPADKCRSVTVFSPQAEQADVLATAVFVLGPEEGMKLIQKVGDSETLIVDSSGEIFMSEGFSSLIAD